MKKYKSKFNYQILSLVLIVAFMTMGFLNDDQKGTKPSPDPLYKYNSEQKSGKNGDSYRLNINNINLPLNRKGIIAAVNIPDPNPVIGGSGGKFAGNTFLFSSGFFLSGYANGQLWANAVASATLVEDYVPGTVAGGQSDPRAQIYVLSSQDEPFGSSWQDWIDAVALGADFYDGDGNGLYEPVDKNGNGEWDPDEDCPDIIGDEMVWCVYNDGVPAAQRRWNTVNPLGIEIRQSVFAFASAGAIGNIVFVRYRFKYVGLGEPNEPDQLDDVYFGVWADPDIGTYDDDIVGSDVDLNAGFTYGNQRDGTYGQQVPCFMIDFFSGPVVYTPGETFTDNDGDGEYTDGVDQSLDTAYSVRGQVIGVKEFPGAKNLPISSFVEYINGDPSLNDPSNKEEARNYILGLDRTGNVPDPCTFAYGEVVGGALCDTINPSFWFSGDPVTNYGWLNTMKVDQRQMTNTGPFVLKKNEEKEIVVAYVVGQGSNPLDGITVARSIDKGAQTIFDNNFLAPSPPPPVKPELKASDSFIDIIWDTPEAVDYFNKTDTYELHFKGFNVWAFNSFNSADVVNNETNAVLLARYDMDDFINNIYKENSETGGIELLYSAAPKTNKLDYDVYSDPVTGKIRLRIYDDPFTGEPLIKGKQYYYAVTGYAINYDALISKSGVAFGTYDDYYLTSASFVGEVENVRTINAVTLGEDLYYPPEEPIAGNQVTGGSRGDLVYDPVAKEELTGDKYQVTFFRDSSTELYSNFWKLTDVTEGTVILDSAKYFLYGSDKINQIPTDGFILRLSNEQAAADTDLTYDFSEMWLDSAASVFHYLTPDIKQATRLQNIGGVLNTYTGNYVSADQLRRIEIRFGETQKAYRYLNGFIGANSSQQQRFFKYAEAVTSADTVGKGTVGKWDVASDHAMGFVDVPFQVWVDDPNFGEMRQLAVGFIEKRKSYGGNPDGEWDPGTSLLLSGEYIFIFNDTYDPDGNQPVYKGGIYLDPDAGWADLNGAGVANGAFYRIPDDANITADQRRKAESPFFNTLYAVGLKKASEEATFSSGDKVIIGVDNYPYTDADVYEFTTSKEGMLTENEEKSLFDKVNVYPNPLYGYNNLTSQIGNNPDDPFVTFTNLPSEAITIKIYSLSGTLLRSLRKDPSDTSPFLRWDLQNESGLRVASGLYLAIISSPKFGDKILKFSIIMPQKQLPRY